MAKKDPAFLFYPSDFITGTMFMSNEQIGIYIKLLCVQHQHGGLIDKASFNALVGSNELLRQKFIETETGFYNERLAIEMNKRNKKSNNLSETAKRVWAERKSEKDTIVIQSYNESKENEYKSNTIVIQPINRNINENNNKIIVESFFSDFPNSSHFETMKMRTGLKDEVILTAFKEFKKVAKFNYPNFDDFCNHFKNWFSKRPTETTAKKRNTI